MTTANKDNLILGLDLGPTSIGWALIRQRFNQPLKDEPVYCEGSEIVDIGVRIFEAGKEAFDTAKESSRCEVRRIARGIRRRFRRLGHRKELLRNLLLSLGIKTESFENDGLDPYILRAKGLDQPLTVTEFARCLCQMCNHRGFKSNRKEGTKEKENSNMLAGAHELENRMKETNARTIGEFFGRLRMADDHANVRNKTDNYNCLVLRDLLEQEFEILWDAQAQFHANDAYWKETFSQDVKKQIHWTIFYQRPMYWRKDVIGYCELEPDQRRAPRADRRAQEFRILQELNNLAWIDEESGTEVQLRSKPVLWKRLYDKLLSSKETSFDQIRKLFGFIETVAFNLEKVGRKALKGMETDAILSGKNYFGKDWRTKSDETKNEIVQIIIERPLAVLGENTAATPKNSNLEQTMSDDQFIKYAMENWGVSQEVAEKLCENPLPTGYGRLSVKALEKLIPALRNRKVYMANDESDSALHEAGYIRRDKKQRPGSDTIPVITQWTSNPVVNRVAAETRRVFNDIVKAYGKPDVVRIELLREVKLNKVQRTEANRKQADNTKARAEAKKALEENGIKPTSEAILRYRLWQQQNHVCIYSGAPISFAQLFSGEVDVDHILPISRSMDDSQMNKVVCFSSENRAKGQQTPVEWLKDGNPVKFDQVVSRARIFPYSKRIRFTQTELDDDFTHKQENDAKYASRYISQMIEQTYPNDGKRYVFATKGSYTSLARHSWGLDSVLNNQEAFLSNSMTPSEKNRNDHRHHAVDALVIALIDGRLLNFIGRLFSQTDKKYNQSFGMPWTSFRQDAAGKINGIVVSHRPKLRTRGSLHNDSNYGPVYYNNGERNEELYVIRKPLVALTQKEVENIRDPHIRRMVKERLEEALIKAGYSRKVKKNKKGEQEESGKYDIEPKKFTEIMKATFGGDNALRFRPEDKTSTPINKVRILVNNKATVSIRDEKNNGKNTVYVQPGNTHHIEVFERVDEKGETKRELVFYSALDVNRTMAARRRLIAQKKKELQKQGMDAETFKKTFAQYKAQIIKQYPVIRRVHPKYPNAEFLFSMGARESFIVKRDGKETIVKFVTSASTEQTLFFKDNRDASKEKSFKVSVNNILKKITVNRLGQIRESHK